MAVLGHAFSTTASSSFVLNFLHIPPYSELTIKNRVLQFFFFFLHIQEISLWKEFESRRRSTVS